MSILRHISLAVVALGLLPSIPAQAETAGEVYGAYSRMMSRSAGQFWADGRAAGQWAWKPLSDTTSEISWGDPAMLDGWRDNGTYYSVRITKEQIGDATCENLRTLATSGRQHYVKWNIPGQAFCL